MILESILKNILLSEYIVQSLCYSKQVCVFQSNSQFHANHFFLVKTGKGAETSDFFFADMSFFIKSAPV